MPVVSYPEGSKNPSNSVPTSTGGSRRIYQCEECAYKTDRRNNLKRHKITMHEECAHSLECCGTFFKSKAQLRSHTHIAHKNGYVCPICFHRFCRKALLKRHYSIHTGQKAFKCPDCVYATSHKSNLQRHRKIHIPLFQEKNNSNSGYASSSQSFSSEEMSPQQSPMSFTSIFNNSAEAFLQRPRTLAIPDDFGLPPFRQLAIPTSNPTEESSYEESIESPMKVYNGSLDVQSRFNLFRRNSRAKVWKLKYLKEMEAQSRQASPQSTFQVRRMRLCKSPYKCHECNETFGSQAELGYHDQMNHMKEDMLLMLSPVTKAPRY